MRNSRFGMLAAIAALLASQAVWAADLTLNSVLYPEGKKVDLAFETTDRAPKAKLDGSVTIQGGQSWIDIKWSKLEPALLFGGEVNCWVLWVVTPGGLTENLGELPVREDRGGQARFATPHKSFAAMVTAEPLPLVRKPSDIVGFVSLPATDKQIENKAFGFGAFRTGTRRDNESIADLKYKDKTPIDLQQARRSIEVMDHYEAEKYAKGPATDARVALQQADDAYGGRVGKAGDVPELSRRAVAAASEAVRTAVLQIEAQRAQETEAKRLGELAEAKARTDAERQARAHVETSLAEVEKQRTAFEAEVVRVQAEKSRVEAEKSKVEADRAQIQRERDKLAQRLSGALGQVAATQSTGRGLVVSLSGEILFDSGKAVLKSAAQVALAKLAGILLMIPDARLQVEGHTDSTGSEDVNAKLSLERARSVLDFLGSQGVGAARMTATGLGSSQPVASNDTGDGKAKNRRVEIVLPGEGSQTSVAR